MAIDPRADGLESLLHALGDEIEDVDEEVFDLFSHTQSSQNLGMIDAHSDCVEIGIGNRDFTIEQSPGVLRSNRESGTTGAAVWRASVNFAQWLASTSNFLFTRKVLSDQSMIIELGSGISALVPLVLRERVGRIIATDQQYALKLLQQNLQANLPTTKAKASSQSHKIVEVLALDWETDDVVAFLRLHDLVHGPDAIVICDCVFNYALIQPLVDACGDICAVRHANRSGSDQKPTLCIVAQQLRQPDVFEQWLRAFSVRFRVWRIPDTLLTDSLKGGSGFVVHLAVLR